MRVKNTHGATARMHSRTMAICALALMGFAPTLQAQDAPEAPGNTPVFEADDLEVQSTTGEQAKVFDRPEAVSVVPRLKILEEIGDDAGDVLRSVPGVYMQRTAAGQASPFIRGMTGKQVLLLVDGVRFNNSAFRSGPNQYFASIDPMFVERIEVVRGPYSVLYGSDALGGVINVISRKPEFFEDRVARPGAMGQWRSANKSYKGYADMPFHIKEANLAGYGTVMRGEYGKLSGGPGIGEQPFTNYDDYAWMGGLDWHINENWTATARFQHSVKNDVYRTDAVTTVVANPAALPAHGFSADYQREFPKQEDTLAIFSAKYTGKDWLKSINISGSYHRIHEELHRITRNGTTGAPSGTQRQQFFTVDTLSLNGQVIMDFGPLANITAGFDIAHDTIDSGRTDVNRTSGAETENLAGAEFPNETKYLSMGVYVQDQMQFADDRLVVTPGLRFSLYKAEANTTQLGYTKDVDQDYSDVTGALTVLWKATDWLHPTASIARGFRAPNHTDLSRIGTSGGNEEIGNPDLDAESIIAAQIGLKSLVANSITNSRAPYRLQAEAFYYEHHFQDTIERVDIGPGTGGGRLLQLQNTGRERIRGFEASFRYYFGPELGLLGLPEDHIFKPGDALSLSGSFNYSRGDNQSANEPSDRIPPILADLSLRYDFSDIDMFIEPSVEIAGSQDRFPSGQNDVRIRRPETPGYTLFHFAAGWEINEHATLRMKVSNIGNKDYQVLGSGVFGAGTDVRLSFELRW